MKKHRRGHFIFCLFSFSFVCWPLLCGGCGIVSLLGTPNRSERTVGAEYELTKPQTGNLLVFVDQPAWLNAEVNLRYHLTEEINRELVKKVKFPSERLVPYSKLSEVRSAQSDFSFVGPTRLAQALNARMILVISIEGFELSKIGETDHYKAALAVRTVLRDVSTGRKLWPTSSESKIVKVGFEVGPHGLEAAVSQLTWALAHCVVRYFYDCPVNQFRIADDKTGMEFESWK